MPRSSIKPGRPPRRRKRIRAFNPERRAKEFARCYHSEERVFFVSATLSCVVPNCDAAEDSYLDNAHAHSGGTGRKGPHTEVFPACRAHHTEHDHGRERFAVKYGVDVDQCTAETERAWQLRGEEVVARAKADGRYALWQAYREAT